MLNHWVPIEGMSVKRPYQRLSRDVIYNILSVYPFLLVRRKGLNRKKSLIMLFINLTNSIELQNKDTPFSLNLSFICIKNYCLFKRFLIQILYHGFAKIAYPKKGLPSVYLKLHFFCLFTLLWSQRKNFIFHHPISIHCAGHVDDTLNFALYSKNIWLTLHNISYFNFTFGNRFWFNYNVHCGVHIFGEHEKLIYHVF